MGPSSPWQACISPLGTPMMAPQGPLWCLSNFLLWACQHLGESCCGPAPVTSFPLSLVPWPSHSLWVETPSGKEEGALGLRSLHPPTHQGICGSLQPFRVPTAIFLICGVVGRRAGDAVSPSFLPWRSPHPYPKEVFQYVRCASLC